MKKIIIALFVLILTANAVAIDTAPISRVRGKGVLGLADKQVMDDFWAQAIEEFLEIQDFTDIALFRDRIAVFAESTQNSAKAQYNKYFYEVAHARLAEAFSLTAAMPKTKKLFFDTNLMILINSIADAKLLDLVVTKLDDKAVTVRYWAFRIVTSDNVIDQINNDQATYTYRIGQILERFKSPEILADPYMMRFAAAFASKVDTSAAQQLLLDIAISRIKLYNTWTVKNEYIDLDLLNALAERLQARPSNAKVAEQFAQLYSFIIQKYVHTIRSGNANQVLIDRLKSVIVQTENSVLPKLQIRQAMLKAALQDMSVDKIQNIKAAHDKLLGSDLARGDLEAKYNFDYHNENGSDRRAPKILLPPTK